MVPALSSAHPLTKAPRPSRLLLGCLWLAAMGWPTLAHAQQAPGAPGPAGAPSMPQPAASAPAYAPGTAPQAATGAQQPKRPTYYPVPGQQPPGRGPAGYAPQPPSGYAQTSPVYGYPAYREYYDPPAGHHRGPLGTIILHHEEGDPIPPGYRLEEGHLKGLAITGGVLSASVYGLTALGTGFIMGTFGPDASGELAVMFIPIAGPIISITLGLDSPEGVILMSLNSATQLAGVFMLMVGLGTKHNHLVLDLPPAAPRVRVAPQAGPNHAGLALIGEF